MPHEISQAPATAELCNRIIGNLNAIETNIENVVKLKPTADALLTFSLAIGWCRDARSLVMEIKGQL